MSLCPICRADAGQPLLVRDAVPVFLNRPHLTYDAARRAPSGRFEFSFCPDCEFGFNAAFDPTLAVYDNQYENEQGNSPAFRRHLQHVIDQAVILRDGSPGPVVEIGCGQGAFLRSLAARIGADTVFVGFDPCCRASNSDRGATQGVRFVRAALRDVPPAEIPRNPSLVYSRHVIEHVPDPVEFLKDWTRLDLVRPATPILLETPDLEWIVRNGAFVDLMYEHCNYFSNRSLRRILLKAGFQLQRMERVFEDQYFLLTAHKQESVQEQPLPVAAISQAVKHFCAAEPKLKQSWLDRLAAAANKGPTAVWGAGAKGVSFVSLLDPDRLLVDCLIDVNPAKQGRFVALTGHQIVSPETAVARGVLAALVMNPNYLDEIRNQLSALAAPVELISLGETPNEIYH